MPEKRAREEAEAEAEAEETSRPEQNEGEGETEASSPIGPHLSEAAQETTATSTTGEAAADSDGDSEPAHPVLSRFGRPRRRAFHPKVPLVTPRKAYFGHLNESTVKDVNFAFRDAYVVSGSDDGNFFLWDKESEELVAVYKGDSNGERWKPAQGFPCVSADTNLDDSQSSTSCNLILISQCSPFRE